ILAWRAATSMKKSLVVILASCAAPVIFLAASLHPSVTAHAQPEGGGTAAAVPTSKPVALPSSASPATQTSPVAQAATPMREKSTQQKHEQSSDEVSTININGGSYNSRSGPRYVIIHANSNSVTMSGDQEDLQHARSLRGKINGDFIWFERDEKSYVITDPAFLDRVKTLFAPQEELEKQQDALGRQQDDLGRQQDELGRQQDELGKQMDAVSVKVPDISPDLERIHARLKQLQASGA